MSRVDHTKMSDSFHALHAISHERDFRVRMSDTAIDFVQKTLLEEVKKAGHHVSPTSSTPRCPACVAGYKLDYLLI